MYLGKCACTITHITSPLPCYSIYFHLNFASYPVLIPLLYLHSTQTINKSSKLYLQLGILRRDHEGQSENNIRKPYHGPQHRHYRNARGQCLSQ